MSNKPRILVISGYPLDSGGVQAVIMSIARNLVSEYAFDILLLTEKKSYYDDAFEALGGKIFRLKEKKGSFWSRADYYLRAGRVYKEICRITKENGPYEAVHCHCHLEAGPCLAAAKRVGVKTRIAHVHIKHNKAHIVSRIYAAVYRRLISRTATHSIGCSELACETSFLKGSQNTVINNPYDSARFSFVQTSNPALSPVLTQIGSFSDNKNQLFSLSVIAEIKKQYPDVRFNIVGFDQGNTLEKIKAKIKELVLESNVEIFPCDTDTAGLLAVSSGFLFPSKKEGFGIVAIEAQAVGVKCYVSDTVPKTTNCGGCEYLPLSAGAKFWADRIIEDFKATGGRHEKYDCSAFAAESVADVYRKIYGGNKL